MLLVCQTVLLRDQERSLIPVNKTISQKKTIRFYLLHAQFSFVTIETRMHLGRVDFRKDLGDCY